jgi:hypothetical protein
MSLCFADARSQPLPILWVTEDERISWVRPAYLYNVERTFGLHRDFMVDRSSHGDRERLSLVLRHALIRHESDSGSHSE